MLMAIQNRQPVIALLTDFGLSDPYVGVMKGVILGVIREMARANGGAESIAPQFIDLTHDIPPQDVAAGALALGQAWKYLPPETIFLCVVDPSVGSARRAVAVRCGERFFVGRDNGLFTAALEEGPLERAVTLDDPRRWLPNPSATFHGRDIFAPITALLAAGLTMESLGTAIDPVTLIRLSFNRPQLRADGTVTAQVAQIDHFGNLITDIGPEVTDSILQAGEPGPRFQLGGRVFTARARTFGEGPAGAPFALRDSSGHLAIAVRNGSAAALLGVTRGAELVVSGLNGQ